MSFQGIIKFERKASSVFIGEIIYIHPYMKYTRGLSFSRLAALSIPYSPRYVFITGIMVVRKQSLYFTVIHCFEPASFLRADRVENYTAARSFITALIIPDLLLVCSSIENSFSPLVRVAPRQLFNVSLDFLVVL